MEAITRFRHEYAFLSNFYPVMVEFGGDTYPSVESAFQAAKTLDPHERLCIRVAQNSAHAKRMGRQVKLRPDWDSIKIDTMLQLLRYKFTQPNLREKLLATGDALLIEGNNHGDRFWGQVNGVGRNELGKLLMHVREEIIRGECFEYHSS